MSFLAPGAFVGLVLLAIPVIVHLFKPRRVRQTPFSSLRWLHLTQQRMARRIQWHQVILFLLRATFLTLLVVALARPLWGVKGQSGGIDRIIVLDVSRSMGRKLEGRPTPFETARDLAVKSIGSMQAGDRAAVLLTGSDTTVLAPWTTDPAPYLPSLESLAPGPTGTNLDTALEMVRTLLDQRRADARVEVFFLTDNMSGSWTSGAISAFVNDLPSDAAKENLSLQLVDVSLPAARNGWLASARVHESPAGRMLHVEASCIGEGTQSRTLHVDGLSGVESLSKPLTLEPERKTVVDLPLPQSFDASASRAHLRLEPADELPGDDELFAILDASGPRLLLIETEFPADEKLRPGFPLKTALTALAESGGLNVQTTVNAPAAVTPAEIAAADVIVLTDVPGLTAPQADALTLRVQGGAGLVIFLGPQVQADVYNQHLIKPLSPAEGILPAPLGGTIAVSPSQGGVKPWGGWNHRHPLVTGLLDPLLGDLPLVRSQAYLRFNQAASKSDEVVAMFDDGTPSLVVRRVGAGRVILVNATSDDRWCDLSRRKSFVPLLDRMLNHVAIAGGGRSFHAGESIALRLPEKPASQPLIVLTPSGKTLSPRQESAGTGTLLKLDGLVEPGVYSVARAGPEPESRPSANKNNVTVFVVQPSRDESAVQPLDSETLCAWFTPARLDVLKPTAIAARLEGSGGRVNLEPWLVAVAGLVLLAEMFLVHWLCPRVNPALATSRHRRGFVPPLKSREGVPS